MHTLEARILDPCSPGNAWPGKRSDWADLLATKNFGIESGELFPVRRYQISVAVFDCTHDQTPTHLSVTENKRLMFNMAITVARTFPGSVQNYPLNILGQRLDPVQSGIGLEQVNIASHMEVRVDGIFDE